MLLVKVDQRATFKWFFFILSLQPRKVAIGCLFSNMILVLCDAFKSSIITNNI